MRSGTYAAVEAQESGAHHADKRVALAPVLILEPGPRAITERDRLLRVAAGARTAEQVAVLVALFSFNAARPYATAESVHLLPTRASTASSAVVSASSRRIACCLSRVLKPPAFCFA